MKVKVGVEIGQKFNSLTVIEKNIVNGRFKDWVVLCDCGNIVNEKSYPLKKGVKRSCGCVKKEFPLSKYPEYITWQNIIRRCYYEKTKQFIDYGGRGIKVCKRWRFSFKNFISDMGRRPSSNHSIDRIKVNKGYSPSNCRWATKEIQMRNRRSNVWISYQGRRMIVYDWVREVGCGTSGSIIYFLKKGK